MLKINKESFSEFLHDVIRYNELVAPVKTDASRFELISDASKIDITEHTLFPAKKFFFKKEETLFNFTGNKMTAPLLEHDKKQMVIIGLKRCDLNAIKRQDIMFINETGDPYYKEQRDRTILIGLQCRQQYDEHCFCSSMELGDYYDLMLYDKGHAYFVEVGSEKGKNFVERYRKFFWDTEAFLTWEDRRIENALRLDKKDITPYYDYPEWKKGHSKCFSCGACVLLCPTCYCFHMDDEVNADNLDEGERKRRWASCQQTCFTKIAGGHIFREKREHMFKHRIYHQLKHFKDRHGINLCVGCGRCIRGCPTKINFVKIINEMKEPQ
jgi:ferredoxin